MKTVGIRGKVSILGAMAALVAARGEDRSRLSQTQPMTRRRSVSIAVMRAITLSSSAAIASECFALTDDEVLARFARATDLPLPQVVQTAGGPTQLVWNTTLDLSVYRNTQSGGAVLNPNAGGTMHRGVLSTDYRRVSEGDVTAWASAQVTQTNDLTAQRHKFLTNKVQIGYSQPGFVGAIGDLAVSHSNLSTNLPIRGAQAQSYFGPVVASAAAGLFVEDWKSAFDRAVRTAYPREAYAFKLSSAPNALDAAIKGLDLYATVQSFSDQATTTAQSPRILNPLNGAKGASASVGAAYKHSTFAANVEFAKSRFDEEGRARLNDSAVMGDISWQGDPVALPIALRLGHHNIGEDFSTLSTVSPGTRESFGNLSWRVTAEFNATVDARQSRYTPSSRTAIIPPPPALPIAPPDPFAPPIPAIMPPPKVITESESASLNFSYTPAAIQGFNSSLTLGRAKTEQVGLDARTQSDNASVNVNYAISGWNTSVNLTHMKNDSFGSNASSAKSTGATVNLGKSFADSTGQRSVNTLISYMKQWQNNGANALQPASKGWNDRLTLTLGLNWVNVGMLNASAYLGHLKDPFSGAIGKQEGAQVDLTWTINPKWNLRAFGRENRNWTALAPQAYKDRSIGASIVGTF